MHTSPTGIRQHGLTAWRAVEGRFDAAFGSRLNPLRHLGARETPRKSFKGSYLAMR